MSKEQQRRLSASIEEVVLPQCTRQRGEYGLFLFLFAWASFSCTLRIYYVSIETEKLYAHLHIVNRPTAHYHHSTLTNSKI